MVGVLVIRGSGLVVIRVSRVLVLRCFLAFRSLLLFELWFVSLWSWVCGWGDHGDSVVVVDDLFGFGCS